MTERWCFLHGLLLYIYFNTSNGTVQCASSYYAEAPNPNDVNTIWCNKRGAWPAASGFYTSLPDTYLSGPNVQTFHRAVTSQDNQNIHAPVGIDNANTNIYTNAINKNLGDTPEEIPKAVTQAWPANDKFAGEYVYPYKTTKNAAIHACLAGYDGEIFKIIDDIKTTTGTEIEVHFYLFYNCKFNVLGSHMTNVKNLQDVLSKYHHYICLNKKYVETMYNAKDHCWYIEKLIVIPSFHSEMDVLHEDLQVQDFSKMCHSSGVEPLVIEVEEKFDNLAKKKEEKIICLSDIDKIYDKSNVNSNVALDFPTHNSNTLQYNTRFNKWKNVISDRSSFDCNSNTFIHPTVSVRSYGPCANIQEYPNNIGVPCTKLEYNEPASDCEKICYCHYCGQNKVPSHVCNNGFYNTPNSCKNYVNGLNIVTAAPVSKIILNTNEEMSNINASPATDSCKTNLLNIAYNTKEASSNVLKFLPVNSYGRPCVVPENNKIEIVNPNTGLYQTNQQSDCWLHQHSYRQNSDVIPPTQISYVSSERCKKTANTATTQRSFTKIPFNCVQSHQTIANNNIYCSNAVLAQSINYGSKYPSKSVVLQPNNVDGSSANDIIFTSPTHTVENQQNDINYSLVSNVINTPETRILVFQPNKNIWKNVLDSKSTKYMATVPHLSYSQVVLKQQSTPISKVPLTLQQNQFVPYVQPLKFFECQRQTGVQLSQIIPTYYTPLQCISQPKPCALYAHELEAVQVHPLETVKPLGTVQSPQIVTSYTPLQSTLRPTPFTPCVQPLKTHQIQPLIPVEPSQIISSYTPLQSTLKQKSFVPCVQPLKADQVRPLIPVEPSQIVSSYTPLQSKFQSKPFDPCVQPLETLVVQPPKGVQPQKTLLSYTTTQSTFQPNQLVPYVQSSNVLSICNPNKLVFPQNQFAAYIQPSEKIPSYAPLQSIISPSTSVNTLRAPQIISSYTSPSLTAYAQKNSNNIITTYEPLQGQENQQFIASEQPLNTVIQNANAVCSSVVPATSSQEILKPIVVPFSSQRRPNLISSPTRLQNMDYHKSYSLPNVEEASVYSDAVPKSSVNDPQTVTQINYISPRDSEPKNKISLYQTTSSDAPVNMHPAVMSDVETVYPTSCIERLGKGMIEDTHSEQIPTYKTILSSAAKAIPPSVTTYVSPKSLPVEYKEFVSKTNTLPCSQQDKRNQQTHMNIELDNSAESIPYDLNAIPESTPNTEPTVFVNILPDKQITPCLLEPSKVKINNIQIVQPERLKKYHNNFVTYIPTSTRTLTPAALTQQNNPNIEVPRCIMQTAPEASNGAYINTIHALIGENIVHKTTAPNMCYEKICPGYNMWSSMPLSNYATRHPAINTILPHNPQYNEVLTNVDSHLVQPKPISLVHIPSNYVTVQPTNIKDNNVIPIVNEPCSTAVNVDMFTPHVATLKVQNIVNTFDPVSSNSNTFVCSEALPEEVKVQLEDNQKLYGPHYFGRAHSNQENTYVTSIAHSPTNNVVPIAYTEVSPNDKLLPYTPNTENVDVIHSHTYAPEKLQIKDVYETARPLGSKLAVKIPPRVPITNVYEIPTYTRHKFAVTPPQGMPNTEIAGTADYQEHTVLSPLDTPIKSNEKYECINSYTPAQQTTGKPSGIPVVEPIQPLHVSIYAGIPNLRNRNGDVKYIINNNVPNVNIVDTTVKKEILRPGYVNIYTAQPVNANEEIYSSVKPVPCAANDPSSTENDIVKINNYTPNINTARTPFRIPWTTSILNTPDMASYSQQKDLSQETFIQPTEIVNNIPLHQSKDGNLIHTFENHQYQRPVLPYLLTKKPENYQCIDSYSKPQPTELTSAPVTNFVTPKYITRKNIPCTQETYINIDSYNKPSDTPIYPSIMPCASGPCVSERISTYTTNPLTVEGYPMPWYNKYRKPGSTDNICDTISTYSRASSSLSEYLPCEKTDGDKMPVQIASYESPVLKLQMPMKTPTQFKGVPFCYRPFNYVPFTNHNRQNGISTNLGHYIKNYRAPSNIENCDNINSFSPRYQQKVCDDINKYILLQPQSDTVSSYILPKKKEEYVTVEAYTEDPKQEFDQVTSYIENVETPNEQFTTYTDPKTREFIKIDSNRKIQSYSPIISYLKPRLSVHNQQKSDLYTTIPYSTYKNQPKHENILRYQTLKNQAYNTIICNNKPCISRKLHEEKIFINNYTEKPAVPYFEHKSLNNDNYIKPISQYGSLNENVISNYQTITPQIYDSLIYNKPQFICGLKSSYSSPQLVKLEPYSTMSPNVAPNLANIAPNLITTYQTLPKVENTVSDLTKTCEASMQTTPDIITTDTIEPKLDMTKVYEETTRSWKPDHVINKYNINPNYVHFTPYIDRFNGIANIPAKTTEECIQIPSYTKNNGYRQPCQDTISIYSPSSPQLKYINEYNSNNPKNIFNEISGYTTAPKEILETINVCYKPKDFLSVHNLIKGSEIVKPICQEISYETQEKPSDLKNGPSIDWYQNPQPYNRLIYTSPEQRSKRVEQYQIVPSYTQNKFYLDRKDKQICPDLILHQKPSYTKPITPNYIRIVTPYKTKPVTPCYTGINTVTPCNTETVSPCNAETVSPCNADIVQPVTPCHTETVTPCYIKYLTPSNTKPVTSNTKFVTPCNTQPLMPCNTATTTPCYIKAFTSTKPITPCNTKTITPCYVKAFTPYNTQSVTPCNIKGFTPCNAHPVAPCDVKTITPCYLEAYTPSSAEPVAPCNTDSVSPFYIKTYTPSNVNPVTPRDTQPATPCNTYTAIPCNIKTYTPYNIQPATPCNADSVKPCYITTNSPCNTHSVTPYKILPAIPCNIHTVTPCYIKTYTPCNTQPVTPYNTVTLTPCYIQPFTPCNRKPATPCNTDTVTPCYIKTYTPCDTQPVTPCKILAATPCNTYTVIPCYIKPVTLLYLKTVKPCYNKGVPQSPQVVPWYTQKEPQCVPCYSLTKKYPCNIHHSPCIPQTVLSNVLQNRLQQQCQVIPCYTVNQNQATHLRYLPSAPQTVTTNVINKLPQTIPGFYLHRSSNSLKGFNPLYASPINVVYKQPQNIPWNSEQRSHSIPCYTAQKDITNLRYSPTTMTYKRPQNMPPMKMQIVPCYTVTEQQTSNAHYVSSTPYNGPTNIYYKRLPVYTEAKPVDVPCYISQQTPDIRYQPIRISPTNVYTQPEQSNIKQGIICQALKNETSYVEVQNFLTRVHNYMTQYIQCNPRLKEAFNKICNDPNALQTKPLASISVLNDNFNNKLPYTVKNVGKNLEIRHYVNKVKIIRPKMVFETEEIEVPNFLPVVKGNQLLNNNVVQNYVRNSLSDDFRVLVVNKPCPRTGNCVLNWDLRTGGRKAVIWPLRYVPT